ncbi:hypothetical protein EMCRGX_G033107 [Ephydatia muelleri]
MASWLYKLVVFGGTVLLGWGVMKATEQSPEKMKKELNITPDLMSQETKRNAELMKILQESAKRPDPIWSPPLK